VWKPVGLGNLSPHLGAGFGCGAGGVPERAEVHVGAGLDDPPWQALGAGLPAPPSRRSSTPATPFPPPLRGRGGVEVGPPEIHLNGSQCQSVSPQLRLRHTPTDSHQR
jgi:hypothetical protein